MRVAVIGAGWAGMAAAIAHRQAGRQVTVFEAARTVGGRARAVPGVLPDGAAATLDNGQHILIGAYTESLRLMRLVGVAPTTALLRLPLTLQFPDGQGLQLPDLPPPLDALLGIARAKGWGWRDKLALLREIEHENFQVLHQRIRLTPLRKFWLAWKMQALGRM